MLEEKVDTDIVCYINIMLIPAKPITISILVYLLSTDETSEQLLLLGNIECRFASACLIHIE
jgi:hypothetical protein